MLKVDREKLDPFCCNPSAPDGSVISAENSVRIDSFRLLLLEEVLLGKPVVQALDGVMKRRRGHTEPAEEPVAHLSKETQVGVTGAHWE